VKPWQKILLAVSLVLNIFLVSTIAGSLIRWRHNRGIGPDWRMRAFETLPPAQADRFRLAMRTTIHDAWPIIEQAHAAREQARILFAAPKFDAAAINAAMDRARAADTVVRARVEHQVTAFASTLPQDQRGRFADALKRGPLRPPHRR
jgi:uncharacterized membrane protein